MRLALRTRPIRVLLATPGWSLKQPHLPLGEVTGIHGDNPGFIRRAAKIAGNTTGLHQLATKQRAAVLILGAAVARMFVGAFDPPTSNKGRSVESNAAKCQPHISGFMMM
jgi:hypothetical protein